LEFILQHAEKAGISRAQTNRQFALLKHGYPKAYDTPWANFVTWWWANPPSTGPSDLSPDTVSVPRLAAYLELLADSKCHESVRTARTSISTAVANATLERLQIGSDQYIIRLMKRLKVAAGISYKKARITSFSDVGHLISTCALLGPDEALPLHILHQKLLTLMSVDLMCRPSDLTRIFRSFKDAGRNEQIRFGKDTSAGTRPRSYYEVRFYDSKELDIGGSRKNSTNDYFSWWVRVYFASKAHLCSGRCLTNFLARSDTSMVPRVDLPHAKIHAHPLFFGPLSPRLIFHH